MYFKSVGVCLWIGVTFTKNRQKSSVVPHPFNYFFTEKLCEKLHILHSVDSVNRIARGLVL